MTGETRVDRETERFLETGESDREKRVVDSPTGESAREKREEGRETERYIDRE